MATDHPQEKMKTNPQQTKPAVPKEAVEIMHVDRKITCYIDDDGELDEARQGAALVCFPVGHQLLQPADTRPFQDQKLCALGG